MKTRERVTLLFLLSVCLFTRVWMIAQAPSSFCFCTRHMSHSQAVMPLMGKHILEKGEFPLFFYGQDWFGSLEAFVHALAFAIFDLKPWVVHVAPVLFFLGLCIFVFLLTKALFGVTAGFWSLLWCAFSPLRLSEYSITPHGGYIDAPMFGTCLLWLAICTVGSKSRKGKSLLYSLMGMVGGLGWWASPMMIYYLLATAAFIILKEKTQAIFRGLLFTLPFFLLGAFAFFYGYATSPHSEVLSMGGGYSLHHLREGLKLLFLDQLPRFLDLHPLREQSKFLFCLGLGFYGLVIGFLFWNLRSDFFKLLSHKKWPDVSNRMILIIFFMVFISVLASSVHIQRGYTQYLIPLATFFSVAFGYWASGFMKRWKWFAPALCVLFLSLQIKTSKATIMKMAPEAEAKAQGYMQLVKRILDIGSDRVYAWLDPGPEIINLFSNENIIASRPLLERYPPYFEELEASAEIAFLNLQNSQLPETFKRIGGSFQEESLEGFLLHHNFQEPDRRYRQIPLEQIKASASHSPERMDQTLDRSMGTIWISPTQRREGMWVQFELDRPRPLGMIRLWNKGKDHGYYASDISIESSENGEVWKEVLPRTQGEPYYWSGPRLYYWEFGYRWEARFGPVLAKFIRIKQYENSPKFAWVIAEAYLYEDIGPGALGRQGETAILKRIKELDLKNVYADRWMSAQIHQMSQGQIETIEPFTGATKFYYPRMKSRQVEWGPKIGFVLEDADADVFQTMMEQEGIPLAREDYPRWVLFYTLNDHELPALWWMGLGLVKMKAA